MRMSMLEQGLPSGFFTRWRAVATGLAVGGVAMIGFGVFARVERYMSEPKTAPACYGRQHLAGTKAIPSRGSRDGGGRSIDDRFPNFDPDKITLALRVCTPQSCPKDALKEFRSAMFWYLSSRLQHTSTLYRNHGELGLLRAREIFRDPIDARVEQGLRERYAAGIFRLNDFRQNHAAVSIIVLKGGDALRPCRIGEPAEED